jgi:hypothetical protein
MTAVEAERKGCQGQPFCEVYMRYDNADTQSDAARLVADAIRAGRLPAKPSPDSLARIAQVIRPVLTKRRSSKAVA